MESLYHFMTKDTYYGNFKDVEEDEDWHVCGEEYQELSSQPKE